MRVITGSARGRKLLAPDGMKVRPTSEMAKEAIFSILHFEVEQAFVLDLFAGSGQLGIEALSRGARFCVFVDQLRESQEVVRQNLQSTGLAANARVAAMDSLAFLSTTNDRFDIALLDPPYEQGLIERALPLLVPKMTEGGIIVCETAKNETLPEQVEDYKQYREYRYGKIKITTYRREEEK